MPATAIFTNIPIAVARRACSRKKDASFYMTGYRKFLIIALVLPLVSCGENSREVVEITGRTMGTVYSIRIPAGRTTVPAARLDYKIKAVLDRINRTMSTYLQDSEVTIINYSNSTGWIPVSEELYSVLSAALEISQRTGGAFDITVGAAVNLWGFGPQNQQGIPDPEEINRALQATGYRSLELAPSPPAMRKAIPGIYLDLSGIAKGYAVDYIADYLYQLGIDHFLVEIGGEIRAGGMNGRNEFWRIGIEKPVASERDIQKIIKLDNTGLATSGDYRNFIVHDNKRYSHTIDPRTGRPVSHHLASVTVLDRSAMIADALSTALLVMGEEKGYRFAEQENIPALFIVNNKGILEEKFTTRLLPYLIE